MPSSPAATALGNWLRDYNEAPWRRYIDSLRSRGLLVEVDGVGWRFQKFLRLLNRDP